MATATISGETRIVLINVAWDVYARLASESSRGATRFAYDRGVLESMSPPREHERLKRRLGRMIEAVTEEAVTEEAVTEELNIPIESAGSTTLKSQLEEQGIEPDECYDLANEPKVRRRDDLDLAADPPPDLAIEVDIPASSLDQLAIYSAFGVPEVWFCDGEKIEFYALATSGTYSRRDRSAALPLLTPADLERFLALRNESDETTWILSFRQWARSLRR